MFYITLFYITEVFFIGWLLGTFFFLRRFLRFVFDLFVERFQLFHIWSSRPKLNFYFTKISAVFSTQTSERPVRFRSRCRTRCFRLECENHDQMRSQELFSKSCLQWNQFECSCQAYGAKYVQIEKFVEAFFVLFLFFFFVWFNRWEIITKEKSLRNLTGSTFFLVDLAALSDLIALKVLISVVSSFIAIVLPPPPTSRAKPRALPRRVLYFFF